MVWFVGSGCRCGLLRDSSRSLVMPPGRHQFAPQSPGWTRVCGTENSGVWVLKGASKTHELPANLDEVGVVWEHRSGHETAWATPGHGRLCPYSYGRGADQQHVVNLRGRSTEVPAGENLDRYAGEGSFIPWHRDDEPLFGQPEESKVIVSMSIGRSVLFKLCHRVLGNTPFQTRLDHGDLLSHEPPT